MKTEQYTFLIQTKVFPEKHTDGKTYIKFKAVSRIDREPGTRKDSVQVARTCYCEGQVWDIFLTQRQKLALFQKPWTEFMAAEQNYLAIGREVIVKGETNEEKFGKKGMHVTYAEIVRRNAPKATEPIFSSSGFVNESIEKEF